MTTNSWDIDTTHSAIHFWVRHLVISKVHGRFAKWTGTVNLDEQDPARSVVEVRIDAASVDTQVGDGLAGDPFKVDAVGAAGAEDLDDHGDLFFRGEMG